MNKNILARQFLALYLLIATIGQGAFLPDAYGALNNTGSISIGIQTESSAPLGITNLNAITINRSDDSITSTGTIRLTWTAPKDLPDNGQVFSYLVRYATFSIEGLAGDETAWWNHPSVKTIMSQGLNENWGVYSTTSPGGTETIVLTGLVPGDYYWFSAKAVDRYNNKSDFDLASKGVTTQPKAYASTSKIEPGNITTLIASQETGTLGRINLSWIADGNDYNSGKILDGKYRIMYSTVDSQIFAGDDKYNPVVKWPGATSIYLSTSNVIPGTPRCYTIDNLTLQTTYFFRIWVADEWYLVDKSTWNWSFESYMSSATPYLDSPPGPVTGFTINVYASSDTAIGSYVKLQWTNPVKWNFNGVKICTSTIVSATTDYPKWQEGGFLTLTGLVSGTTGEYTFTRLIPWTSYFYSIYAFSTNGLYSSRTTAYKYISADVIKPDPLTGLIAVGDANPSLGTYIELDWTNPDASKYQNLDWKNIKIYVSTNSYPAGASAGNISSLERTLAKSATGCLFANLPIQHTTYYFSIFNYDWGNNCSSATISYFVWKDTVPPSPMIVQSVSPSFSYDVSSGCMLNLSLKYPPDVDLERLYIAGREDRYPVSFDDGSPELSELLTNPAPNQQVTCLRTELIGNVTYYFTLYLFDWSGNMSSVSVSGIVIVPLDNVVPLIPNYVNAAKSGDTFTVCWQKAAYSYNSGSPETLFNISTTTPKSTDVYRYQVYVSTDIINWKLVKRAKPSDSAAYSTSAAPVRYYKIRAVDIMGDYTDSLIASSDGFIYSMAPDYSSVRIPGAISSGLENVYIRWFEDKTREAGPIIRSWKIEPSIIVDRKYQSISGFKFSQPQAEISISYGDLSNSPNPSAMSITEPEKWLSNFYFNGMEWLKLPSAVNAQKHFVKSTVKFLGLFQIRIALNATELTLYKVFPKIITPNRDGKNDQAIFQFENPRTTTLKIKVFDITGALVKDLGDYDRNSYVGGTIKSWDGTDSNGISVPPGTYIYQIEGEGKTFNGTIIVAR